MANWNKNNRACTTTWTTLRVLDQNRKVFKESGEVTMTGLTFWNPTASAEMRKIQATTLADEMDKTFLRVRKAKYEEGIDREKALKDMVGILISEEKAISDLAEIIDADYQFWGEETDE
jgi:hypothetical protein